MQNSTYISLYVASERSDMCIFLYFHVNTFINLCVDIYIYKHLHINCDTPWLRGGKEREEGTCFLLYIHINLSIYLSIYFSIYLSIYLYTNIYLYIQSHLERRVFLSSSLYTHMYILYIHIIQSINLSMYLSTYVYSNMHV